MIATLRRGALIVAPLQRGDRALYLRLYCDPQTMRFIGQPLEAAAAERSFEAALQHNAAADPWRRTWRVAAAPDTPASGLIALVANPAGAGDSAELGGLFEASVRGQRHVGLALLAVIAHAFDDLGLQQLRAAHAAEHRIAERVAAKLGFVRAESDDRPGELHWQMRRSDRLNSADRGHRAATSAR